MKRVILDTNIYGRIVYDKDIDEIKELIKTKVVVFGNDLIRKELRAAPKISADYPRNLRMDLIRLYNYFVKATFDITKGITSLAEKYYHTYSELSGRMPKEAVMNDLIIVACASYHDLDLVVSEDRKTILDSGFQTAFKIVNKIVEERMPNFLDYDEFKIMLRRSLL